MRRSVALAAVVLLLAACGGDDDIDDSGPEGCHDASNRQVTLVAQDLQWDTDCLQASAGPLTIVVDNQDDGQNHNLHLPTADGSPATDLTQGPSQQELDVELGPGSYEYVCDIHPNMVGTLNIT
jgi:plastocyanin